MADAKAVFRSSHMLTISVQGRLISRCSLPVSKSVPFRLHHPPSSPLAGASRGFLIDENHWVFSRSLRFASVA